MKQKQAARKARKLGTGDALRASSLAEQKREEAERQRRAAELQRAVAQQRRYGTEIQLAQNEIETGKFGSADKILRAWIPSSNQNDLRGWEWY